MSHNIFFLDIETVVCYQDYSQLDSRGQKLWEKKTSYQREQKEIFAEDFYLERGGIFPEFAKIICVSIGIVYTEEDQQKVKINSFYETEEKTEKQLLLELKQLFDNYPNYSFCAHNGKEFDFPFLARRMLMHGITLPHQLDLKGKKPWEVPHIDTMELWKFGDYRSFISLDLLAYSLGIESPKDDIDGSQVHDTYYKKNDIKKIVEYCQRDVVTLINVYFKIIQKPIIDKENILS